MKIRLLLITAIFAMSFSSALLDLERSVAQSKDQTASISVFGTQPWTDTGIDLNLGDQVEITAGDHIKYSYADPGTYPDGSSLGGYDLAMPCPFDVLFPEAACWSLIGRIGEAGPLFSVGYGPTFSPETEGRLYLGVNDDPVFFGDNSGAWEVTLRISQGSQPGDENPPPLIEGEALHYSLIGSWEGNGTQTNPPVDWPITMEFTGGGVNEVVGTVGYSTLDCGGDLELMDVSTASASVTLAEDITYGEANCLDGGTFLISVPSPGVMEFSWEDSDGGATAFGTLSQVNSGSAQQIEPINSAPGEDSATADVWLGATTCSSSTEVEFHILVQADNFSGFVDCTGSAPATSFTIIDAMGQAQTVETVENSSPLKLDLAVGASTITENSSGASQTFDIPPLDLSLRVPDSCRGRAGCVGIIVTMPPTEIVPLVDTSRLHEFFVGEWAGTGTQTNPDLEWPISVTLTGGSQGDIIGTVDYPASDCGGELTLTNIDPDDPFLSIEVSEDITYGEENCIDGGSFVFSGAEGGRRLIFRWVSPTGFERSVRAEGALDPVEPVNEVPPLGCLVTPTIIEGPRVEVRSTQATISWSTDEPAIGVVHYGQTTAFDQASAQPEALTAHRVELVGLTPGTTYYFTVRTGNACGQAEATERRSFTTYPAPDFSPDPVAGNSAPLPPPEALHPFLANIPACAADLSGVSGLSELVTAAEVLIAIAEGEFLTTSTLLTTLSPPYTACIAAVVNLLVPGQLDALEYCLVEETEDAQGCRQILTNCLLGQDAEARQCREEMQQRLREILPDIAFPQG